MGCRKRSKKAATSRWNGSLQMFKERSDGSSKMFKVGLDGSLEEVVGNVQ
jgi:hypothetical protein